MPTEKTWSTALYIRLSREDEDMAGSESNSITSQREFLKEFLRQHQDLKLYDIYIDDGWSGTNFNRPDFQRMLRDLESRQINCVVVKDLSRFGRNASQTGYYLDDLFPRLQVRFIAVNNYIDTVANKMNAAAQCITVGIQNVVNESYAAQTSVSVRSTLNTERSKGAFIGSFASYGYRKDPEDHHRLLIDEPAAEVVRQIYRWFLGGKSILGIAKQLNAMGIPNPSMYKKQKGYKYHHPRGLNEDGLWPDSSVRRILRNEIYTGTMVQGKNTTISYKHKQCRAVPKEEWYVVEGTHEPIIDRETFEKAQALFNRQIRKSPKKDDAGLFAGLVRCGDCKRMMTKKTNVLPYGTYSYYRCTTARKMSAKACTNHTIRIDKLEQAVLVTIQKMIDTVIQISDILEAIQNNPQRTTNTAHLENTLHDALAQKAKLENAQADLYPDWKCGLLDQDEYLRLKARLREQLAAVEKNIENIQSSIQEYHDGLGQDNDCLTAFRKYGNIKHLTRPMLLELVDQILVYEGGSIEVCFK